MTDILKLSEKTHVVLIHETVRESWLRDAGTVVAFLFLWSIGHFAGSAALEWVGVALGGLFIFLRAMAYFKRGMDRSRMTPEEAREWLDAHFPKGASHD